MFNYSTMLLREDLGLLVVGAREVIYALDLKDISKKHASVRGPLSFINMHVTTSTLEQNLLIINILFLKFLIRAFLGRVHTNMCKVPCCVSLNSA